MSLKESLSSHQWADSHPAQGTGQVAASDEQLLAAVLAAGGRARSGLTLAQGVLELAGGLTGLERIGAASLRQVPGLGAARAARLAACVEIGRRIRVRAAAPRRRLDSPDAVAACIGPRIGALECEQMWVLAVDAANRLRGMRCVSQGGHHGCSVSAREILRSALADAACGFILAHNHPSGEPAPSADDIAMTRTVARAAEVVGTPLLDHVIVTASGAFCSLMNYGVL